MGGTDRVTGKTTKVIEEAIDLLALLPGDCRVFITGAHTRHLRGLRKDFKASGLVDVEFYTAHQVATGCLRGRRGLLLIDDMRDIPHKEFRVIMEEQLRLRRQCGS